MQRSISPDVKVYDSAGPCVLVTLRFMRIISPWQPATQTLVPETTGSYSIIGIAETMAHNDRVSGYGFAVQCFPATDVVTRVVSTSCRDIPRLNVGECPGKLGNAHGSCQKTS